MWEGYDALAQMSGRMSFSLALLDDHGDGVAISAITGLSDTRVYAKPIAGGQGEQELSPEERQAVSAALDDKTLRAEADKMQFDVDPLGGEELQKLVSDLYATPTRLVERARQALTVKPQR